MRKNGLKIFTLLAIFLLMSMTFRGAESKLVLNPYYSIAGAAVAQGPTSRIRLLDTDYSHYLALIWNENRAANQTLNFITGAGDRTVTLSGNLTVESASLVNQDLTSDASPSFGGLGLTGNLTLAANSITGTSVDINNAEMQQLSNITANTISNAQWGYLGAMNQGVTTTSTPTFGALTLGTSLTFGANPTIQWDSNYLYLRSEAATGVLALQGSIAGNHTPRFDIYEGTTTTVTVSINGTGVITCGGNPPDLTLANGSITDSSGAISFGDEDLSTTGNIFINDTANADMTTGLTINQGAADDEIFCLKSSDVTHGMTTQAETDTYLSIFKRSNAGGGVALRAAVVINGSKKDGTGATVMGADDNILVIQNNYSTRFIFDEDGDMFYDGAAPANYDAFDDAAACSDVQRVLYNLDKPKERQLMDFKKYTASELIDMGVISDGGFVSTKRMNALILGAVGQLDDTGKAQAQRIDELESQVTQLQAMVEAQAQQLQAAIALLTSRQEQNNP